MCNTFESVSTKLTRSGLEPSEDRATLGPGGSGRCTHPTGRVYIIRITLHYQNRERAGR